VRCACGSPGPKFHTSLYVQWNRLKLTYIGHQRALFPPVIKSVRRGMALLWGGGAGGSVAPTDQNVLPAFTLNGMGSNAQIWGIKGNSSIPYNQIFPPVDGCLAGGRAGCFVAPPSPGQNVIQAFMIDGMASNSHQRAHFHPRYSSLPLKVPE
jgi:hypothetical protein